MLTDIAIGKRAENGVDQRVQSDIAVGMGEKTAIVRHPHPADHQMIAIAESVHIIAAAGSDVAERRIEARFLAREIFRCREFHVGSIAFESCDRQSHPFGERGVVGEIVAALTFGAAMRVQDRIEAELNLSASFGVATNKLVAKIASDLRKPHAVTVVPPGEEAAFLAPLAIRKLWGVGQVTGRELERLGVQTIGDLAHAP